MEPLVYRNQQGWNKTFHITITPAPIWKLTQEYSQLTSNNKDPIIKNTDFSPWVKTDKGGKSFRFLSPPGKIKKGKIHKHHWQENKAGPRE